MNYAGILGIKGGFTKYCLADQYLKDVMNNTTSFNRVTPTSDRTIYLNYVIYGNFIQRFFRFRKLQKAIQFLNEHGIEIDFLYSKD